eukprot:3755486-Rhodomonas_salina.1
MSYRRLLRIGDNGTEMWYAASRAVAATKLAPSPASVALRASVLEGFVGGREGRGEEEEEDEEEEEEGVWKQREGRREGEGEGPR